MFEQLFIKIVKWHYHCLQHIVSTHDWLRIVLLYPQKWFTNRVINKMREINNTQTKPKSVIILTKNTKFPN